MGFEESFLYSSCQLSILLINSLGVRPHLSTPQLEKQGSRRHIVGCYCQRSRGLHLYMSEMFNGTAELPRTVWQLLPVLIWYIRGPEFREMISFRGNAGALVEDQL